VNERNAHPNPNPNLQTHAGEKADFIPRTLVAATFVESILCHGQLISGMRIFFYKPWLFKMPPDVWRLVTPFLLTSGGLGFIFDLYFCMSLSE
jgi:Der1-like family